VSRGESLERARESVDLSVFRASFAGESRLRGFLFDAYVSGPAVARAYAQLADSAGPAGGIAPAGAQERLGPSRGALARGTIAVTNATVIPMTGDTVLRDATVIVRDGRVVEVGPASRVRVPRDARRVDGRGRWLIPGLADVHTHLYTDGEVPDSFAADELAIMLANGVTAARLMMGTPEQLALRADVAAGRMAGPQLWLASPQFTENPNAELAHVVRTPDEARAAVRDAAARGYDFLKITVPMTRPVYDAIVEEAKRLGIRLTGHVDPRVGVARALEAGQQIEHLDGYFEAVVADSSPVTASVSSYGIYSPPAWPSLDHMSDAKIDSIAGATARAGAYTTPTLAIFNEAFALGTSDAEIRARPDWAIMPAKLRQGYLATREKYWSDASRKVRTEARRRRYVEVRNRLTRAVADSGGRIMAGSDTPEWFHAYGWGLHRELAALVTAGLSPHAALRTATATPAEYLGAATEWGAIAPGRRADFVLLSADPLADVRNTTRIEGVAIGGRWLERKELDAMLERAVRRLGAAGGVGE
jgi:imidazolonepropionase-like amidohydrolase